MYLGMDNVEQLYSMGRHGVDDKIVWEVVPRFSQV